MRLVSAVLRSVSGKAIALSIAGLLSACGGGGDDGALDSPTMQAQAARKSSAPRYSVKDLGTLCDPGGFPPCGVSANGVNDKGEIAGSTFNVSAQHAMVYRDGALKDIGGFPPGGWAAATAINDLSQVTGWSTVQGDEAIPGFAFLYNGGALQNLGALGGQYSGGYGINNRGQVTGRAQLADGSIHAFLYSGGTMHDIGTLGGTLASGMAINDQGRVAGFSYLAGNVAQHAFLYQHGAMKDLGTLGGSTSVAQGINSKEEVVGYSYLATNASLRRAFLYSGHKMQDLGTLAGGESVAFGIDDKGHVVGGSDGSAFLYSDGVMHNLNDLLDSTGAGWVIEEANAISGEGIITGRGRFNGRARVFVLVPLSTRILH
jgi:probable HAF family extracellular repeat protein